jgi:hypothetical protein
VNPEIRYAKSGDVHIAYQVFGNPHTLEPQFDRTSALFGVYRRGKGQGSVHTTAEERLRYGSPGQSGSGRCKGDTHADVSLGSFRLRHCAQ